MSPKQRRLLAVPALLFGFLLLNALASVFTSDQVTIIINVLIITGVGVAVALMIKQTLMIQDLHETVAGMGRHHEGVHFTTVGLAELWEQLETPLVPPEPAPEMDLDEGFDVFLTENLLQFRRHEKDGDGDLLLMLATEYIVAIEPSEATVETTGTTGPALSFAFLGDGMRGVLTIAAPTSRDPDDLADELGGYLTTVR